MILSLGSFWAITLFFTLALGVGHGCKAPSFHGSPWETKFVAYTEENCGGHRYELDLTTMTTGQTCGQTGSCHYIGDGTGANGDKVRGRVASFVWKTQHGKSSFKLFTKENCEGHAVGHATSTQWIDSSVHHKNRGIVSVQICPVS
ncbi:hypothetical protein BV22DRAFT_1031270 [Leucogyrophana mollusca]|uniref:Uncharacterized protein n=1 Tax=Leucogyrophana mollusca TaxID=85980 RepID=A0ACB8BTJ7_9AGAM|nr:hypothetical protein BV22DRAFT_1031270 [Leucogyrophana mollusca]